MIHGVLDFARSGILVRMGKAWETRLRDRVFKVSFGQGTPVASVQRAMADVRATCEVATAGVISVVFDLVWTPFFVLLCYLMHPLLGAIALASVVGLFSLAILSEWITSKALRSAGTSNAVAAGILHSAFSGIEAARGLGMGAALNRQWREALDEGDACGLRASERAAGLQAMSRMSRLLVQIALMGTGAMLAVQGEISPSVMIASSIIMSRALAPVEQIVMHWSRVVNYRAASSRLRELLSVPQAAHSPVELPRPEGRLEAANVTICLEKGARPVVAGVSFALDPGTSVAVLGSSGSGKSTLARSLVGAVSPIAGSVRLDGATFDQWESDKLGAHLGYLPQSVDLLEGTVAQNIARFRDATDADVIAAAQEAGVHDAILRLPDGYQTQLGPAGQGLSGGMRQRVALARALFGSPRLVVLDEPNSNLDDEGERSLLASIARMKAAGRTVVLVTHRPQILRAIDNVLVLNQGRQVAFGPTDEVAAKMRGNKLAAV